MIGAGSSGIGIYVANEGGPSWAGGYDVGILANIGVGLGGGASAELSVGAFEGAAADLASPTHEVDVNIPVSGGVGVSLDGSFDFNPNDGDGLGVIPISDDLPGSSGSPLQDAMNGVSELLEPISAVGVGLSVGASVNLGSPTATGTLGLSGVNGDGLPFNESDNWENRR